MFRLAISTIVSVTALVFVCGCGESVENAEPANGNGWTGERGSGDEGQRDVVGQGDLYAFLVAVRQYDPAELTSLQFTENDVTELAETLKTVGYEEGNILLMTQTVGATRTRMLPTRQNIQEQLSLLIRELKPDDTLLLAFSGHGLQFKDKDESYYCPADARVSDRSTLISMDDVYAQLESDCQARTKLLLMDACRNDPMSRLSRSANAEIELDASGVPQRVELPGSLTAFFSCSAGEKSYEHPDIGHGVFLNFVIEGLGGKADFDRDGEVSLAELEQFSVKQTQRFVRVNLSRAQTPERRGESRGLVTLARLATATPRTGDIPREVSPVPISDTSSPSPPPPPPPAQPRRPLNLDDVITNSVGMKLKLIPAGEFLMGSPVSEKGRVEGETQHRVRISQGFYLQTTEVTQGQWELVMGTKPWKGQPYVTEGPDYAANYVSWSEAMEFCQKLSAKEGVTYRLPTEAEWEYACRAGTETAYSFGDDAASLSDYAWWGGNVDDDANQAHRVGLKRPNPWGLYDMHGNVWEWCSDYYDLNYYQWSPATDPQGPSTGIKVYRGGKWLTAASSCRSADRERNPASFRWSVLGMRAVRSAAR